ncbi:translocation/assembly module TamB domain-containing protein [Marinobacter subterrani]|uniref:Autotransporter translocation and assembly factor TamB n=1 Tax=Marinobacter subterrani TaxID=1658765 RepID=A0A0J7JAJ4_9GAMM|nr:translocation/assembly module TamB domain-containing protein [Marinobacter subterrani]KMQ74974.1 Autotransporter translocation and assembly factor TamB [Marinobacter subterrani]
MTQTPEQPTDQKPKRPGARHRLRFWLLLCLGLLVLLPVLLVSAVLLALRSETGTAWVIDQVPGLQVTHGRGSLLGQWQARHLEWRGYGVEVIVQAPRVDWSPSCLLRKQLCLDTLQAEKLTITQLPPADKSGGSGGVTLPGVDLPLGLRVTGVRMGTLTFNGTKIWDRLELDAGGSGAAWNIDRLLYRLDDYKVTASGRVETRRDWPVNLEVTASLPPPYGDEWVVEATLSGSVRDLMVNARSRGYLEASLEGQVQPLDPALPARLKVTSDKFLATPALPETLMLRGWFVEAQGSLQNGFRTRGQARLPGTTGPVKLLLEGLVTTEAAQDVRIELATANESGSGQDTVVATGKVNWIGGLNASADLRLRGFPWYTLVPQLGPPPVSLQSLDGTVSWQEGNYQAQLTAEVDSPQGKAEVSATVDGDLEKVRLTDLALVTGAGSLVGNGSVNYAGAVAWQAALQLKDFNPGFWVPALEASLSGEVKTEGQLRDGEIPDMSARWNLEGAWRSNPASLVGNLDTSSGNWELSGLELAVGENTLEGSGVWGDRLRTNLALAVPRPEAILPGLAGSLQATLEAGGTPTDPTAVLKASARNLSWQEKLAAERLTLDARLEPGMRLTSSLEGSDIAAFGQELKALTVTANGQQSEHRITVSASHAEANLELAFEGGAGPDWQTWQGALARGLIALPEQDQRWQLQSPAALAFSESGELTFGNHCWRWQQSSVCAEDQTLLPVPRIAYTINRFPTGALAPLLPETLRWDALINGEIDFSVTDAGPDGRIFLDAGDGEFQVLVDGDWEPLAYNAFTTEMNLKPQRAKLDVRLKGPELGEFSLDLGLDPTAKERRVDGSFRLKGLDLALAGLFTGIQDIAGQIDGEGQLSGPLMKPAVNGAVHLTNGRISDPTLPVPLEEVVASLEFNGYSAQLSGRIESNARSQTIIDGQFDWQRAPEGEITVTGKRVPFNIEPYARLEIAPDLKIAFREGALQVTGQVGVPRGSIEIEGLPPQAVSVSKDEVIVGAQKEEPVVRSLEMDVTVVVGEDKLTFAAFGLTGNLEGTLRITDNMDTRGTLRLVNGRYEAYGQELELKRARLLFVGNLAQPYLDIEAVREVGTVIAGIRLSGPVQSPQTEVFSNPDMPQTDALSYLILGRPPQGGGDQGQMTRAALSLGLTQANKVTGQIGEELGIRQLTLEAEGSGEQTSVVASGYLTDDLSVRYGVGVFEPITTVALRYDLGKYFYLEAASGLAASLDIFYTRDF